MKAYKGFNKDMTCRGFRYEEGKEYETETAKCCKSGFHACEYPLDCFKYYAPNAAVFHEVEVDGEIDICDDNTKVSATNIRVGAQLDIAEIVKASIEYVKERVKPEAKSDEEYGSSSATGDCGASSATGNYGASSATGDCGASSATGNCGASSATGDYGASSATGSCGVSSITGYKGASETKDAEALAVAWGYNSKAKGVVSSYIVLTEWTYDGEEDAESETSDYRNDKDNWHLKEVRLVQIDGETLKADTWYMLRDGNVVEADF